MKTNQVTQNFYDTVYCIDENVEISTRVIVNGKPETIILVFKNNLHTVSGKILKSFDIDNDEDLVKLTNDIKFKYLN